MIVLIPLILAITFMVCILIKKRTDITNSIILICSTVGGGIYLHLFADFSPDLQLFIIVALLIIIPVVGVIIILVDYISKIHKRDYASSYLDEIRRKAFHFIGFVVFMPKYFFWLAYIISISGFNNTFSANLQNFSLEQSGYISLIIFTVTYPLLVLFTLTEFIRLNYKPDLFISLVRRDESDRMASYLHTTTSIFLVSLVFYPYDSIVCAAISMGLLSDLAACIVGKRFHRISYKDRSLEGFLANFSVGSLVGYFFVGKIAILVALVIALIDFMNGALELKLNDNFLFPVLVAILLYIFMVAF